MTGAAPAPRSRKQEQSEETRRRLLVVARALFAERGHGGTSLEDVAHRAGMTRGAVYHQFRHKRALFEALVREMVADAFDRAPAGRASLERRVDALLERATEPAFQRIVLQEGPAVLGAEAWQAALGPLRGVLRGLVQDAGSGDHPEARLQEPLTDAMLGALTGVSARLARPGRSGRSGRAARISARDALLRLLSGRSTRGRGRGAR